MVQNIKENISSLLVKDSNTINALFNDENNDENRNQIQTVIN